MRKHGDLPSFRNPPVIEVVCGLHFKPLEGLLAPHLGLYWDRIKADYPGCQEKPPLAPVVESFGGEREAAVALSTVPPLPRIWFIHREESEVIQIQRDRILHNWKKVRMDDSYPRYEHVIHQFKENFAVLGEFLEEHRLGRMIPVQCEMTYLNQIELGKPDEPLADVGSVLPDFQWRKLPGRFFGIPESFAWRTTFPLPDQAGRLHITMQAGARRQDGIPLLLLDLTARGLAQEHSHGALWRWFDLAHEWIVRGFADLTSEELQRDSWNRIG